MPDDPQQPIRVEVQGVGTVEFPAGTSQQEMETALKQLSDKGGENPTAWQGALAASKQFFENAPELSVPRWIGRNQPAVGATIGSVVGFGAGGPAGAVGGAALGGAAGEATQQLTNRLAGQPAPATPLEAAQDIGMQGAVQGGIEGLTRGTAAVAGPYLQAAGGRLMQSALKPSGAIKSVLKDVRAGVPVPKVVQTLLDEGVNVSAGGIAKLNDIIGGLNAEVQGAIGSLTGTIAKPTVAAHMAPAAAKIAKQGAATAELQSFGDVVSDFLNHPVYKGALTPAEAQAMKVATYGSVDYAKLGNAANQARKALGYGLKEEIEQTAASQGRTDIRALNAREGRAIEAMDAVVKRVAQAGNTNPVGLAALAHAKAGFLTLLVDRSPVVKSYIARGLYTPAASILGISPHLLRSLVVATASAQDESQ